MNQNKNEIYVKKIYDTYIERMEYVDKSDEVKRGLSIISDISMIVQNILYHEGVKNIWLVPITDTINEYSKEDFKVVNPLNQRTYSLVQSPQVQKQSAAVLVGSNFRLATCFRAEKGDPTHSQVFQQIDVELANYKTEEVRKLIEKIVIETIRGITGTRIGKIYEFNQKELIELYGQEEPNLFHGILLSFENSRREVVLSGGNLELCDEIVDVGTSVLGKDCIEKNEKWSIVLENNQENVKKLRKLRIELIRNGYFEKREETFLLYKVLKMPYANIKNDKLKPVHHIMTLPIQAKSNISFDYSKLDNKELTELEFESFDLIVCTKSNSVEVVGGDERINNMKLQKEALERFDFSVKQHKLLLDVLEFNDKRKKPVTLSGFAIGLERFAQIILGYYDMDYVQLFPTNSPCGDFVHAIGMEMDDEL